MTTVSDHWRYLGHRGITGSPITAAADPGLAVSPAAGTGDDLAQVRGRLAAAARNGSPHDDGIGAAGDGDTGAGPHFNVTQRGKVTYYMEGDGVISSLVTKREADGDLLIHFAGLTGGTSITSRPCLLQASIQKNTFPVQGESLQRSR